MLFRYSNSKYKQPYTRFGGIGTRSGNIVDLNIVILDKHNKTDMAIVGNWHNETIMLHWIAANTEATLLKLVNI